MNARHLSFGMYARIRPARPVNHHRPSLNQRQHAREFPLHRTLLALYLPAMKIRPVILKRQLKIHKK
jgi:hypothetical protein